MTEAEFVDKHAKAFYSKRWEHRMTQADVARKAGISPELVSKLESGESHPSLRKTFKIAAAFGMSTSEYVAYIESGEILATKKVRKSSPRNYY